MVGRCCVIAKKEETKKDKPEKEKFSKQVTKEDMKKFREKVKKDKKEEETSDIAKTIATRSKLERDFKEDQIYVTFNTSPETRRTVLATRPTQKEFLQILNLSIQASKFEGLGDAESLEKIGNIYEGLHKIAAKLCVDKSLDEEFWSNSVGFNVLTNFLGEVINSSQQLGVGGVTEAEMKKFRRK